MGRQEEVQEAIEIIQRRKQKSPTKAEKKRKSLIERMEQDVFTRKLREVFYEQWTSSKIMCVQGQYHRK